MSVENVLGERRAVLHSCPDGSYSCPFCAAAVLADETSRPCPNPACEAGPYASAQEVLARRARRAENEQRIAERKRLSAEHAAYEEQARRRRDAQIASIREEGYCALCFVRSGQRKRIRHRNPNHHQPGGRR